MRILTTASYCGTGSSAITDFLTEFNTCKSLGDYEFRFAQDPDGIADLEYNLVENNHRLNSSEAIKRYIRMAKRLNGTWYAKEYELYFGSEWLEATNRYISNLTQLKSKVWWHQDQIDRGEFFRFADRFINKVYRTIMRASGSYGKCISLLEFNEQGYFTYIEESDFLQYTRKYTRELFEYANKGGMPFFVVDQLVPASNVARYSRYFDDLVVFVVERDPRDIYLREKTAGWGIIPTSTVEDFCKWYRITREHRKHEKLPNNAFFVQFEDFVYKYDATSKKIMDFAGLKNEDHKDKFKHFDPQISIKNTNLKDKYPEYKNDVCFIEKNLKEYLYDF